MLTNTEVAMEDVEAFDDEELASDVGEWKDSFGMSPHPGTHSVHCSPCLASLTPSFLY
jgi:hypothetical protein